MAGARGGPRCGTAEVTLAWVRQCWVPTCAQRLLCRLTRDVEETDRQIEAINRARSLSQTGVAGKLNTLHADWLAQASALLLGALSHPAAAHSNTACRSRRTRP